MVFVDFYAGGWVLVAAWLDLAAACCALGCIHSMHDVPGMRAPSVESVKVSGAEAKFTGVCLYPDNTYRYFFKHGVRLLKNGRPYGDGLLREFNRLPHHTPGPGGIASLDPQTVLQYLTLCVTTIMRP